MERVKIFDTTLRDGEQSPGFSMNINEKVRMAKQLEKLGVDIIEAGFPVASRGDFEAVRMISQSLEKSHVAGLARAHDRDIERAWEAIQHARHPRIHTFISTSDIHLTHQLRKSREEVLLMAAAAVTKAKSFTDDVGISDVTRLLMLPGSEMIMPSDSGIWIPALSATALLDSISSVRRYSSW